MTVVQMTVVTICLSFYFPCLSRTNFFDDHLPITNFFDDHLPIIPSLLPTRLPFLYYKYENNEHAFAFYIKSVQTFIK